MQRLVSSSTAAIRSALERRAASLESGTSDQLRLFEDDWAELTGEEQFSALAAMRGSAWATERQEVERLLDLARQAESSGLDAKALFFLDLLRRLQREEHDPAAKVLVFTEFVPTQDMILGLFSNAGVDAVGVNGSMSLAERDLAQQAFRSTAQVLVSTDAGGEGVNLQHAHLVVNWDLPWSPSRLEQRLGRVDRIGQKHPVRGFNLVAENSIDARVLSVLEDKLAVILAEFGADKRSDIIETVSTHTDAVYARALNGEADLAASAANLVEHARSELQAQASLRDLLPSGTGNPRTTGDRLTAALTSAVTARRQLCDSQGPDPLEALEGLPSIAPGKPVPLVSGPERGWWGVWELRADASSQARTTLALFVADSGGVRPDLAEQLWDLLMTSPDATQSMIPASDVWDQLARTALDYAYRPCSELAGGSLPTTPAIRPLLIVRVNT